MQKIMIIDDEIDILHMLERYFRLNGYLVITAEGGEEALNKLSQQPDIILLDINMPDMDGISLCKNIRNFIACPILFLTANANDKDKIKGFSAGGDDYIVKPFSIDELGARVSAHLRRENRNKVKTQVMFDVHFVIDYSQRAVFYKNKEILFTKKEFDIIEILSQNPGQVLIKSGCTRQPGALTVWEIILLLQSISARSEQNSQQPVPDSTSRQFGELDTNGQNKEN